MRSGVPFSRPCIATLTLVAASGLAPPGTAAGWAQWRGSGKMAVVDRRAELTESESTSGMALKARVPGHEWSSSIAWVIK